MPGIGLLAAAVAVAGLVSVLRATNEPAQALTNCDTTTGEMDSMELELLGLINAERAKLGRAPLLPSTGLARAAAWMAEDFDWDGNRNHDDSLDRDPWERAADCGYAGLTGENLIWGRSGPADAFAGWMDSPLHKQNMLSSSHLFAGVGRSGHVWALDLGVVDDSTATPPASTATATPTPTPTPAPTPPPVAVIAGLSRD